jgi:hypothetical protein
MCGSPIRRSGSEYTAGLSREKERLTASDLSLVFPSLVFPKRLSTSDLSPTFRSCPQLFVPSAEALISCEAPLDNSRSENRYRSRPRRPRFPFPTRERNSLWFSRRAGFPDPGALLGRRSSPIDNDNDDESESDWVGCWGQVRCLRVGRMLGTGQMSACGYPNLEESYRPVEERIPNWSPQPIKKDKGETETAFHF